MIYTFLAEGFEEIEALTPVDCLRRAGVAVQTVGIGGNIITGSHGIAVAADCEETAVDFTQMTGIILPGGMPGTRNLEACAVVQQAIAVCAEKGKMMAAICAAPSILGHKGCLAGKKATCFPGFEKECEGAIILPAPIVTDGSIITAKGAGCALLFGAAIVAYMVGHDASKKLLQDIQWNDERYS